MASESEESIVGERLALPEKPSIAVLPFVNMSEDPQQEYFSDGITEEVITGLSKVSHLFVIASTSSFTYKGKQIKIQQVGRDLGVQYVLEGSVRKSGARVRITAQLINASTEHHLWPEYAMAYIYLAILHAVDVWLGSSKSRGDSLTSATELVKSRCPSMNPCLQRMASWGLFI